MYTSNDTKGKCGDPSLVNPSQPQDLLDRDGTANKGLRISVPIKGPILKVHVLAQGVPSTLFKKSTIISYLIFHGIITIIFFLYSQKKF